MARRAATFAACFGTAILAACLLGSGPARAMTIVLVTENNGSLTSEESARRTQLQSWGHTVTTLWDAASQSTYDTALASADVVYVPEECTSTDVDYKLRTTKAGVLLEEALLDVEMGFATSDGATTNTTQINIVDPAIGTTAIFSSSQPETYLQGTIAVGFHTSAQTPGGQKCIGSIEAGSPLANTYNGNSVASGRRVRLPWGGDSFAFSSLNSTGLSVLQTALAFAGEETLLLHWKLDEASGTSAADSSSYGHTGTVSGTTSWIAGRRRNGFDFNGSTKIEATTLLNNPKSFSLACWARIDAADSSGAEGISVGDYLILRLHSPGAGGPQGIFYAGSSTWRTVDCSTSYIGRGWHHFATTFDDEANSLKLYVDGSLVATASTTSSVSWSGLGTKTRAGSHGNTNTNFDFDGAIDDVRIYEKILTAEEVVELYGLVGRWKLDETSGTAAADSSGFGLGGTHTNGPVVGQAGPYPGAGQYAAAFDGTNDYVDGAAATNYTFADGFTIAAWVNLDTYIDWAAILQCGATTNSCELAISSTGQVRLSGRSSGGLQTHTTTATLPLGKWKHVVGTFNGTTFTVYVDGVSVSSASSTFSVVTGSGDLSLAASLEGTDQFLDGRLHDVRLYNRAIAAEEVGELYGLIGQWKLAETSGTVADDTSSLNNDGTYTNGPTLAQAGPYPGAGQYAAQFDGSNDYVATGPINSDLSKGFTIAAWARPTSLGSWQHFLDVGNSSDVDNIFLGRNSTTTDLSLRVCDGSAGTGTLTATGALESNIWHHFVAICDSSGNAKIYRDGQQVASGSVGTPGNVQRTSNFIARSNWAADAYYQGRLQDVRLYNRPLSTAEVAEIYGLVGHWKFNEGSGTTLADSSGAGAGAAVNSGAPSWISGVYSNALSFNGTTDDAITSASFNPPSVGTVAFWMKPNGTPAATQRQLGLGGDWEVRQGTDGIVYFDLCGDATGGFTTVSTPTKAGSWYHLAATFDSADESYAVYVNGVLDKSGASSVALVAQAAAQLSFGTRTGTTERFAGGLDDIRVYNRKLSPWEIYQIYGLMAWYKFDETSGTAAADSTGRGQDGVYNGSPTLNVTANGAASQGAAVAFNGSNYMQVSGLYDKSTSVSAAAWVRLDAADTAGADAISLGDCFYLRLNSGTSGAKAAYYNGSSYVTATASQIIVSTGWHHFAAVLDGGSTIKIYVDGVEAASAAVSGAISYSGQGANTRVATHGNGGTTTDLTGRVDDVRVFNRALKPDEVFQLYHGSRINGVKILQWVETR